MKKTARLDQILLRLGYCSQEQITRALHRQKSQGGLLGGNLLDLGVITAEQLLEALSEQFRLPTLVPKEQALQDELVRRMPEDLVRDGRVLPLSWNEEQRVLSIAASNPGDVESIRRAKEAFDARAVRIALAPEARMLALGRKLGPAAGVDAVGGRVVLPELFASDAVDGDSLEETAPADDGPRTRVLMVTGAASRKNVLPDVFRREGCELTVVSTRDEAAGALGKAPFDRVLLSHEMAEPYSEWLRDDGFPRPRAEVVVFPSVSGALLENPLPYEATVRSLKTSVQALADYRCAQFGASPPYGLIATEVEALALRHGLRRVVRDALQLAVHLLLPGAGPSNGDASPEPFAAFASSLELATRIHFPWKLDAVLAACHALYTGREEPGRWGEETLLAARILSLTWYRHVHLEVLPGTAEERMIALRTSLRTEGGRLATPELAESYLRTIAERGGVADDLGDRQVMVVGRERILRALAPALSRVGREALATDDLADAQTLAERRPPAAIVIDHDEFPDQVDKFSRVTKLGGAALLFVLSDSTDPSLVLNLLDVGVDDVFCPPHDFDLVAARINRAIRSRSRDRASDRPQTGQFSATFEVFSFLDLIQMLSHGLKSVRIDLSRDDGERAVVFMRKGRMTHAASGELSGEPAVHRVITWEDDGEFTVREESRFPPEPTIAAATESVLMEGLRLLDEARR